MRYIDKEKKFIAQPYQEIDMYTSVEMKDPMWEIIPTGLSKREEQILDLRLKGHTFKEIGEKLGGYTRGWANKLFKSALKKIRTANEEKKNPVL